MFSLDLTDWETRVPIHYLERPANLEQFNDMLQALGALIKLAVDVRRGVAAGGGEFHADCVGVLLELGSDPRDIWGADYWPGSDTIKFEAMINLMPSRNNPSLEIRDPETRCRVEAILRALLPERPA